MRYTIPQLSEFSFYIVGFLPSFPLSTHDFPFPSPPLHTLRASIYTSAPLSQFQPPPPSHSISTAPLPKQPSNARPPSPTLSMASLYAISQSASVKPSSLFSRQLRNNNVNPSGKKNLLHNKLLPQYRLLPLQSQRPSSPSSPPSSPSLAGQPTVKPSKQPSLLKMIHPRERNLDFLGTILMTR
jgi:hypothetical protein